MEETSIPDELTYHEPAPHHAGEPRDALFMTARIVSLIFTPFMVPFVAFCLLFFFTYLNIMPLQYKLTVLGWCIASPSCYRCWASICFRKSTAGHSTNWDTAKSVLSLTE